MGESQLVHLGLNRLDDFPVTMAKARDSGAAGSVKIAFACSVDQPAAFAADGDGRGILRVAGKDVGHGEGIQLVTIGKRWLNSGLPSNGHKNNVCF